MRLRQLEVFKAVMETGTTSRASKLLLISQPAVSSQLRQFESQLGIELFQRRGGRLVATEEARQVYEKALSVFESFQAVESFVEGLREGASGRLHFACSPTIAYGPLPRTLDRFNQAYPGVPISFDTPSNERIVSMILSEGAEFGLTITPLQHSFLESDRLSSSPIYYVWPKEWALNHPAGPLDPDRIAWERLILYPKSSGIGQIMYGVFHDLNLDVRPWIEVRYVWNALRFVEADCGATLTDKISAEAATTGKIDFRPVATGRRVPWIVTYRQKHGLSIVARAFLDKLHVL